MRWWKVALTVLVVLGALAFAGWWFVLRDDAPSEAALPVRTTPSTSPGATPSAAEGSWTVQPGDDVFAGYRITEQFAGDTIQKTAVGRSPAVTGTMTVQGTQIPTARFDVDLTELASDSGRRDGSQRGGGLQTDQFPTAGFTLTAPVTLPGPPALNVPVNVQATGDLTLHGVTRPVTFALQANWTGELVDVAGSAPIVLGDFGIEPPSVGGFVQVAGDGVVEVQLTFARA